MHTIVGASGQVGSAVVRNLLKNRQPVKGVIRNEKKASGLQKEGAAVAVADIHDEPALTDAFRDTTTAFVLTPESGQEKDMLGDTRTVLENYRKALSKSPARRLVGLSSVGAQHGAGTGNLLMSHMLEHAFTDLPLKKIFIRPSYYFSNWLPYAETVRTDGILPTFFPPDLSIPMISPMDVAEIVAGIMADDKYASGPTTGDLPVIYELEGPSWYSSNDVARAFSEIVNKPVRVEQIPRAQWENAMKEMGLSADGVKNFVEMTEAVINGKALPERSATINLKGKTTLKEYLMEALKGKD